MNSNGAKRTAFRSNRSEKYGHCTYTCITESVHCFLYCVVFRLQSSLRIWRIECPDSTWTSAGPQTQQTTPVFTNRDFSCRYRLTHNKQTLTPSFLTVHYMCIQRVFTSCYWLWSVCLYVGGYRRCILPKLFLSGRDWWADGIKRPFWKWPQNHHHGTLASA